jgi:hypothetical protein
MHYSRLILKFQLDMQAEKARSLLFVLTLQITNMFTLFTRYSNFCRTLSHYYLRIWRFSLLVEFHGNFVKICTPWTIGTFELIFVRCLIECHCSRKKSDF